MPQAVIQIAQTLATLAGTGLSPQVLEQRMMAQLRTITHHLVPPNLVPFLEQVRGLQNAYRTSHANFHPSFSTTYALELHKPLTDANMVLVETLVCTVLVWYSVHFAFSGVFPVRTSVMLVSMWLLMRR